MNLPKDLDLVIKLIIYYEINVKYILVTKILIKANGPQFIWPDFYWSILRCEDIHNNYSSEFICKIVPLEWHEWWFDDIVLQFPAYYNSIFITGPQ